jgi:ribosomal protein S18 acetylase RimI-like enzyme
VPPPSDLAADVAGLIETNVAAFLLTMGVAGGGAVRDDSEVTWTVGGSPIGYHNAVVGCTATNERAAALVLEWRGELESRRVPGSWHLTPSQPKALVDALVAAGFRADGDEPAMALDLTTLPRPASTSGHIDVRTIDDKAGLDEYRRTLGDGFGEGPKEADWVSAVFSVIGFGPNSPWRHLVGYLDNEPVATATVFATGLAAGVYFISTRPAYRRQGIGELMTRRALTEAASLGAQFAVLGSSPMGQRIYERIGFRTLFSSQLFEWAP